MALGQLIAGRFARRLAVPPLPRLFQLARIGPRACGSAAVASGAAPALLPPAPPAPPGTPKEQPGGQKFHRERLLNGEEEVLTDEEKKEKDTIIKELTRRLSGPLADENGNVPTGKDRPVAIEVDGPSHFYANSKRYTAYTKLKHRLLTRMGYKVLHVPYYDWRRLRGAKEREEYMKNKLLEEPTEWLDPEDEKYYSQGPLEDEEELSAKPVPPPPTPPPPRAAAPSSGSSSSATVKSPGPPASPAAGSRVPGPPTPAGSAADGPPPPPRKGSGTMPAPPPPPPPPQPRPPALAGLESAERRPRRGSASGLPSPPPSPPQPGVGGPQTPVVNFPPYPPLPK